MKDFLISRVITRNMITDMFQSIRNLFGMRLRSYEEMIKNTYEDIIEEMRITYGKSVKWYRISINPLTNGSVMVNLYGEIK